jgi:hypothetical protein
MAQDRLFARRDGLERLGEGLPAARRVAPAQPIQSHVEPYARALHWQVLHTPDMPRYAGSWMDADSRDIGHGLPRPP